MLWWQYAGNSDTDHMSFLSTLSMIIMKQLFSFSLRKDDYSPPEVFIGENPEYLEKEPWVELSKDEYSPQDELKGESQEDPEDEGWVDLKDLHTQFKVEHRPM